MNGKLRVLREPGSERVHYTKELEKFYLLEEKLVGARVLGEGTHLGISHITVHRFNLVFPVGDARDSITNGTVRSYHQGSSIEKERRQWGELVAAIIFTVTSRPRALRPLIL